MLFQALFLIFPLLAAAQSGGFSATCNNCRIVQPQWDNPVLACYCNQDGGKSPEWKSLYLNQCFWNDAGTVKYMHNGNLGGSCGGYSIGRNELSGYCAVSNAKGAGAKEFFINLDQFVGNMGGNLVC